MSVGGQPGPISSRLDSVRGRPESRTRSANADFPRRLPARRGERTSARIPHRRVHRAIEPRYEPRPDAAKLALDVIALHQALRREPQCPLLDELDSWSELELIAERTPRSRGTGLDSARS